MAPARKRGRAPGSGSSPAPSRRRQTPASRVVAQDLQESARVEATVQPRQRTRRVQARTVPTVRRQADATASGPAPQVEGAAVGISAEDNGALQGQISSLTQQVDQLRALLQAQVTPPAPQPASSTHAAPPPPVTPTPSPVTTEAAPTPGPVTTGVTPTADLDDASPFMDALRMLSDTGTLMPGTQNEFMSFGFSRLDSSVSAEMRNIIHSKKFINLEVLLPGRVGAVDFLFNQSLPHKVSVHSSKLKKFSTFDDWFEAYLIFAAVYTQKFHNESHGILKHLSAVKRLHRQGFKWYEYDFEFRHFVASHSCAFDVYLPELIERAKERQPYLSGSQAPRKPSYGNKSIQPFHVPGGFCFSFARYNACKKQPCQYKHECFFCGKYHSASTCPERRQQQQQQQRGDKRDAHTSKSAFSSHNRGT